MKVQTVHMYLAMSQAQGMVAALPALGWQGYNMVDSDHVLAGVSLLSTPDPGIEYIQVQRF